MSLATTPEFYYPAIAAIGYYALVFVVAEITRKVVDRLFSVNSAPYVFAMEFIGTAMMCTCVYENGVMAKFYGLYGIFFTIAALLSVGTYVNRGASVSPLGPIEAAYYNTISPYRLLNLLLAEACGAFCAFRFARFIWFYTLEYSQVHLENYVNNDCTLSYKIPFYLVVLFEVVGCGFIRLVVANLPNSIKPYAIPTFISFMLCTALVYVGVPGLNPVVASSRLFGCQGLDAQWFIAVYWICPVIGWIAAAEFDRNYLKKSAKKIKKNK